MPKIYIAHPKDDESESVELRALGLKFNKAAPSQVGLIGLRQLEQPGYESYIHHIAGFMYATDTGERQRLYKVGFPIKLPISECFPLLQPPLHLKFKQSEVEKGESVLGKYQISYQKTRQKTGKDEFSILTADDCVSALGPIRSIGSMRSHPPAGQVSFDGMLAYLLCRRIFSSFYRTHTYPAYAAPTQEEDYTGLKRRIEDEEATGTEAKRRAIGEGVPVHTSDGDQPMETDDDQAKDKVVLRYAKPSDKSQMPWGHHVHDIPNSYGIVFPFVAQLANWDKDTVPSVMETYFLRCFGETDDKISIAYSKFVESWKSEVYSTHAGIILSHMAKVISVAMPAQARPFPLFEVGQYRGCYLVGANFSVAIKASLTRPDTFDSNRIDLSSMFGKFRLLSWLVSEIIEKDDIDTFKKTDFRSLREVHNWIISEGYNVKEEMQQARAMAANANFPTTYLPVTVDNVSKAITGALDGEVFPEWPIHYEALFSKDPLEVNLSAFGPGVPSPHIPGGKEISVFQVPPPQSSACFRRCRLRSAVSEWMDVIEKGTVRNEPRNLNARFQFVKVTGMEDKAKWYQMMESVIKLGREKTIRIDSKIGSESYAKKADASGAIDDLFDF